MKGESRETVSWIWPWIGRKMKFKLPMWSKNLQVSFSQLQGVPCWWLRAESILKNGLQLKEGASPKIKTPSPRATFMQTRVHAVALRPAPWSEFEMFLKCQSSFTLPPEICCNCSPSLPLSSASFISL